MPSQLQSVTLDGKNIILEYQTPQGLAEVIETSAVNISGSLPATKGTYTLTIKAWDEYVNVSYR